MELHARTYYTADVLGVMDTMHPVIFQAMNVDRKPLGSEQDIAKLFTANGVSAEDFSKAFSSLTQPLSPVGFITGQVPEKSLIFDIRFGFFGLICKPTSFGSLVAE